MIITNFCRIFIILFISIFFIRCNNKENSFIVSKKIFNEKYFGKIEEINVYYFQPVNICFDIKIEDDGLVNIVKSMDVSFYIQIKNSKCDFYNLYDIDNSLLDICIYTDFLDCYLKDHTLIDKQKRETFFNEMELYIVDNKTKREFVIDLSEAKVIFNEVNDRYQRPF